MVRSETIGTEGWIFRFIIFFILKGYWYGLVDTYGGLEKAIEIATILAKTGDDYRIISLPKKKDPFAELAIKLGEGASISDIVMQKIGLQTKLTNPIEDLLKADKIQARIPFIMELK